MAAVFLVGCARLGQSEAGTGEQPAGATQLQAPSYTVMCDEGADSAIVCSVDHDTYTGWGQYTKYCAGCHGSSAFGTERGPDLTQSLDTNIDYFDIHFVIMRGRHSPEGDMPSWEGEAEVVNQIDQIYRYLKARADAVLPPGVPNRTKQ
ncbi:MAG: c-type cytochrome [Gammaproteobacteria bacterium]|nr:c-type cytochrome [Gammaproteobacteria bacterium]